MDSFKYMDIEQCTNSIIFIHTYILYIILHLHRRDQDCGYPSDGVFMFVAVATRQTQSQQTTEVQLYRT